MSRPPCTGALTRAFAPRRASTVSLIHLRQSLVSPALPSARFSFHSTRLSSTSAPKSSGGNRWINPVLALVAAASLYAVWQKRSSAEPPRGSTEAQGTSYASAEELKTAIQELRNTFPEEHVVETNPDVLQQYGSSDNSYHPSAPHSVAIRVQSTEDVVKVVNISRKYRVPITAYSGATSLEGHYSGVSCLFPFFYWGYTNSRLYGKYPSGSICIDMSGMDEILAINGNYSQS